MSETVCTFTLDEKNKKQLEEISEKEHRSLSGQIRLILEEWLKNYNE